MGKGVASSLKVSMNIEKRPQFNSLINVLKPKVYITDSSSFKKLVQDLTGNGSCCSSSRTSSSGSGCYGSRDPSLSPPPFEPEVEKVDVQIIDVGEQESFSAYDLLSFDPLEQYYLDDQTYANSSDESSNLAWEANLSFSNMDQLFLENQLPVADAEWSAYQDLESWLLDTDQQPLQYHDHNGYDFNNVIGAHEQEAAAFSLDDICRWLL
uniref:VQ domain-containing protein n=1 Tax=Kalanchoe fedtschenkoi TaxID=63787 RepID=A0A7N0SX51_KALFE